MATLDKTAKSAVFHQSRVQVLSNTIDLAAVATGDVVQAITVPAGWLVTDVYSKVEVATGLTSTATVGDGSGANSWDASINLNATAGTFTRSAVGTDAYATTGKRYATSDTIDFTCTISSGPIVAGSVTIYAVCVKLA